MSKNLHPDSPAIDRLGSAILVEHFGVTRQAVSYWRRAGVPKHFRKPLALLAKSHGVEAPEMAGIR